MARLEATSVTLLGAMASAVALATAAVEVSPELARAKVGTAAVAVAAATTEVMLRGAPGVVPRTTADVTKTGGM